LARAHIGRNSGIFGSKPIRRSLPPLIEVSLVVAADSWSQSLVVNVPGSSPASASASLLIISTRLL
jgi:hypothetical protein